ncbi:PolC-type DNA polymerase III [Methanobrevibacter sp.]|uniref:3'-5' exonuclease n=1 Tax=Methanobrevibacter sp. TaxID=66852 RepID=UPI0038646C31
MRIVYFDTETTGVKPGKDHIIELALLVYDDGKLTEEYDEFIQIDEKLPSKIVELTGITDEMLKDEGVAAKDAAAKIITVLKKDSVWVAHNTQFDLLFIYNLLKEYFDEEDILDKLSKVKWLDTLTIFKDRAGYPHRLENMVEHYKLEDVRFHRAIDDARALKECLRELKVERNDIKEYVNLFGYNPKYGVTGEKFQFITYARQPYFNGLKAYRNILPKTIKEE